mmetsp:Transcript_59176/g.141305  ORF Transcript_59176/g.141305 Transcript_59176/m.141305 type:complete len:201 (-) Transcript_59176:380-982(-)
MVGGRDAFSRSDADGVSLQQPGFSWGEMFDVWRLHPSLVTLKVLATASVASLPYLKSGSPGSTAMQLPLTCRLAPVSHVIAPSGGNLATGAWAVTKVALRSHSGPVSNRSSSGLVIATSFAASVCARSSFGVEDPFSIFRQRLKYVSPHRRGIRAKRSLKPSQSLPSGIHTASGLEATSCSNGGSWVNQCMSKRMYARYL